MNRSILSLALLYAATLFADLDSQIDQFFDRFNVAKNKTSSDAVNSQLGVHFLGANGVVRTSVYDVNPIHVQLPSFSAGCGGIDFTLGGINIASRQEMKSALKAIASNGVSYAFLLGIETASPLVSSVMKQVQTWANQLNAININSCEIATSLVQGVWPKTQRASSYICEHAGAGLPMFQDLIEAKHGCRESKAREAAFTLAQGNNQQLLVGDFNIAWKAMAQMSLDDETKNLFLNMTGTIVGKETSKKGVVERVVQVYPPQYKKALELLRLGGQMENAYQIADDGVGIQSNQTLSIRPESAWKFKVYKVLKQIQEKILQENKQPSLSLTEEEKSLINTTHFPMGSLLSLMTQYNGKGALIALDRYSDLIAFERALKFAEEVLQSTMSKAEGLRAAQVNGYELDEYIKQVQAVLKDLQTLNMENYQKIGAEQQVIDYLIKIDRTLRDRDRGL